MQEINEARPFQANIQIQASDRSSKTKSDIGVNPERQQAAQ